VRNAGFGSDTLSNHGAWHAHHPVGIQETATPPQARKVTSTEGAPIKQPHDLVLELLQRIAVVPPGGIRPDHELVRDLQVDGDDYGMWLVPQLKKRLGIKPQRREWEIRTVAELLAVVDRHAGRAPTTDELSSA